MIPFWSGSDATYVTVIRRRLVYGSELAVEAGVFSSTRAAADVLTVSMLPTLSVDE